MPAADANNSLLPPEIQADLQKQLEPGETLLAWLDGDLDENLRFATTLLTLTDCRLLCRLPDGTWRRWRNTDVVSVELTQQGALGAVEFVGAERQLFEARVTAARLGPARRFVEHWKGLRRDSQEQARESICPSCGAPMPADMEKCPACTPKPVVKVHASLYRLLPIAKARQGMILLGLSLAIASTAASLVPPYLTRPLMDKVLIPFTNGVPIDHNLVYLYLGGLGIAAIVAWLLGWARSYVLAWVSERISADLRTRTYDHLQKLSLEFFGGKRTGDLMSRLSSDTDRICDFLSLNLMDFMTDVMMMTLTSAILLWINPLLAIITLAPFPIIAWLVHRVRQRLRRGFRVGARAWAEMTSVLADTIPGIRVVKAFAQEHREVARFRKSNDHILQANDRTNAVWAFFGPTVTLLTEFGLLVVWGCGVYLVMQERVSVGTLTMFLAYISRFYTKLESLSWMAGAVQRASASAQRLFEILDRQPSVAEPARPVEPGRLSGEIEIRNVHFQYGNRRVLHDINLKIAPGEMIGLVGQSGAGKSTLVNLVCRFYDVVEGAILVDAQDIRSFPIAAYRKNIGIVLQEPFLFYGTIAENIAYGLPDATREEIVHAAMAAGAHEFILKLPDGYDSIVGERGQLLSGGERQRISIARALLIDPAILILDEATSSVDTETEREIQQALERLIQGRTTIAIAHRLSTLNRADRVIVLDAGRIVEEGSHDDLLNRDGHYARLYQAQFEQCLPASPATEFAAQTEET